MASIFGFERLNILTQEGAQEVPKVDFVNKRGRNFERILWLMAFILLLIPIKACIRYSNPSHTEAFYVNDFAQVLSPIQRAIYWNKALLDELSGAQLVVVTIDSTMASPWRICLGYPQEGGNWEQGKKQGVLILLAVEDENPGLRWAMAEGALPTENRLIQDEYMVPYFSAGDYSTGILRL